jgi:hypothetical protein
MNAGKQPWRTANEGMQLLTGPAFLLCVILASLQPARQLILDVTLAIVP